MGVLITLYKNIHEIKEKLKEPEVRQTERILAVEKKTDALAEAMCALLRVEINNIFTKANDDGYITSDNFEIVTKLYESYHNLGGNGVITKEMAIIDGLQIV